MPDLCRSRLPYGLPQLGDAALLSLAVEGERNVRERALAEIARRHAAALTSYAERLAPGSGEDVCQEVLLELVARHRSLRDNGALRGWLFQVASNKAMDVHRKRHASRNAHLDDDVTSLPDPDADIETQVERHAQAAALLAALDEQPRARRETLVLRFVQGLSNSEIERVRGVTGVKQEVSRSLPILRAAYARHAELEPGEV